MMLTRIPTLVTLVLMLAAAGRADTVFVWPDGTGPYPTISAAVDGVPDGSTVYLLAGTYTGPGNRDVALSGKNVSLMAFGGTAVVDCQGLGTAFQLGSGVDASSVIQGIAFRNGTAAAGSGGGAVHCLNAGPTIRDCSFSDNSATYGGAVRAIGQPSPVIEGCTFSDNSAVYGGAIDASGADIRVETSTFLENGADHGGAIALSDCLAQVIRCTMCRNLAPSGSALEMERSSADIERCIIAFNLMGQTLLGEESSEISFSCLFGNAGGAPGGDAHDNYADDPLLCDVLSGDCHLCQNSYCLPSMNPWGYHIGHLAQGCGECEDSPVEQTSWGVIKARYR